MTIFMTVFGVIAVFAIIACLFEIKIVLENMLDFFIKKGEECNGNKNCREE